MRPVLLQELAHAATELEKEAWWYATLLTQLFISDARDTDKVCSYLFDIISIGKQ